MRQSIPIAIISPVVEGSPFRYYTSVSHVTHAFCVPDSKLFYKSAPSITPNPSLACFGNFSMKHNLPCNLNRRSLCPLLSLKNQLSGTLTREHCPLSLTFQAGCTGCVFMHPLPGSSVNIACPVSGKSPCALDIHASLIPSPPSLLFIHYSHSLKH